MSKQDTWQALKFPLIRDCDNCKHNCYSPSGEIEEALYDLKRFVCKSTSKSRWEWDREQD